MQIGFIYKITSPNKRVYIGQTLNYKKRFKSYSTADCKGQPRLYASFKKYGVDKHKFELITECSADEMNKWERYYQDLYHCLGKFGLNCKLTCYSDRNGGWSDETKAKISASRKGIKASPETIAKMKAAHANRIRLPQTQEQIDRLIHANKTRVWSHESKAKMSKTKTGIKANFTEDQLKALSIKGRAFRHSPEVRAAMLNKPPASEETKRKVSNSKKGIATTFKTVFHPATGVYYTSAKEVAKLNKINYAYLIQRLTGRKRNTSGYVYA